MPSLARIRFVCCLLILGILLLRGYRLVAHIFLNLASTQYVRAFQMSTFEPVQTAALLESSKSLFNQAIQWSPDLERAFVGMGRVYIQRQNYTAGAMVLRRALDLRVNDPIARFQLGNTYEAMGQIEHAIEEWRKGGAAPYFLQLGNRYRDANPRNFGMAVDAYRLATAIDPSFVDAYYAEASVLWATNQANQASEAIERALAVDRVPSARRSFYQGQLHLIRHQPGAATLDFQEVLRLGPNYPQGKLFLGTALIESGRFEEAARILEQAISSDPSDIWLYIYLFRAYRALNRVDLASYWYKKAMDIDPHVVKLYLDQ